MDGEDHTTDDPTVSYSLRACETCRHRKIKCDRLMPCSSCRTLNVSCQTVGPTRKKRRREASPKSRDDRLEAIEAQLLRLDGTLREAIHSQTGATTARPVSSSSSIHTAKSSAAATPARAPETQIEDTIYQGDSSFDVRSAETSKLLEGDINNLGQLNRSHDVAVISDKVSRLSRCNRTCTHNHFDHNLPMPPQDLILKAVRIAKGDRLRLMLNFAVFDQDILVDKCQKVYFPVEGYSIADFVTVHAALLTIIRSCSKLEFRQLGLSAMEVQETTALCQSNVKAALERTNLFMQPCMDNIVALIHGAHVTLGESELTMAWNLTSLAARLCLDAGLHRLNDDSRDPRLNYKKLCFWHLYTLDKGLALNFGRTPNLQDFDVSTSYPNAYHWVSQSPWHTLTRYFFDFSRIQSQIYEKLYSAHGRGQDMSAKTEAAKPIIASIKSIINLCKDDDEEVDYRDEFEATRDSLIMSLCSILTLTYSSIRSTQMSASLGFSEACISTARTCLQLHCELSKKFMSQGDEFWRAYVDWGLLFCPFTPFLAIIGALVSNPNCNEDKKLLNHVITSLEAAAEQSPGAAKLCEICRMLYQSALKSISGRQGQNGGQMTSYDQPAPEYRQQFSTANQNSSEQPYTQGSHGYADSAFAPHANTQQTFTLPDTSMDLFTWFEDHLGNNTSMLDILEGDQTQTSWDMANL